MNTEKKIKAAIAYSGNTQKSIADPFGLTTANLNIKIKKGNFTLDDFEKLAEIIGAKFEAYFIFDDGTKI